MLPLTLDTPKPLQLVGGAPLLRHLMDVFARQGWCEFVLAAGHLGNRVADFVTTLPLSWEVHVIQGGEAASTAERIRGCLPFVDERCIVTYGDGIGDIDLETLVRTHTVHKRLATVTVVPMRSQFGIVRVAKAQRVLSFQQKPVIRNLWINAGFIVLEQAALRRSYMDFEGVLLTELAAEGQLTAHRHLGYWKAVDTVADLEAMNDDIRQGRVPWLTTAASS